LHFSFGNIEENSNMHPKRNCQFKYDTHSQQQYAMMNVKEQQQELNGFRKFDNNGPGFNVFRSFVYFFVCNVQDGAHWKQLYLSWLYKNMELETGLFVVTFYPTTILHNLIHLHKSCMDNKV
jgi:hypothetical protein